MRRERGGRSRSLFRFPLDLQLIRSHLKEIFKPQTYNWINFNVERKSSSTFSEQDFPVPLRKNLNPAHRTSHWIWYVSRISSRHRLKRRKTRVTWACSSMLRATLLPVMEEFTFSLSIFLSPGPIMQTTSTRLKTNLAPLAPWSIND